MKKTFRKSDYESLSPEAIEKFICALKKIKHEFDLAGSIVELPSLGFQSDCNSMYPDQLKGFLKKIKNEGLIKKHDYILEGKDEDEKFLNREIRIHLSNNFDTRYKEYQNMLVDILEEMERPKSITPKQQGGPKPICITKGDLGFLIIEGGKVLIGGKNTRKFRLIQCLCELFGTARTIDMIFESIKLSKDKKDSDLQSEYLSKERKIQIIKNTFKEIQRTLVQERSKIIEQGKSKNKSNKINLKLCIEDNKMWLKK